MRAARSAARRASGAGGVGPTGRQPPAMRMEKGPIGSPCPPVLGMRNMLSKSFMWWRPLPLGPRPKPSVAVAWAAWAAWAAKAPWRTAKALWRTQKAAWAHPPHSQTAEQRHPLGVAGDRRPPSLCAGLPRRSRGPPALGPEEARGATTRRFRKESKEEHVFRAGLGQGVDNLRGKCAQHPAKPREALRSPAKIGKCR